MHSDRRRASLAGSYNASKASTAVPTLTTPRQESSGSTAADDLFGSPILSRPLQPNPGDHFQLIPSPQTAARTEKRALRVGPPSASSEPYDDSNSLTPLTASQTSFRGGRGAGRRPRHSVVSSSTLSSTSMLSSSGQGERTGKKKTSGPPKPNNGKGANGGTAAVVRHGGAQVVNYNDLLRQEAVHAEGEYVWQEGEPPCRAAAGTGGSEPTATTVATGASSAPWRMTGHLSPSPAVPGEFAAVDEAFRSFSSPIPPLPRVDGGTGSLPAAQPAGGTGAGSFLHASSFTAGVVRDTARTGSTPPLPPLVPHAATTTTTHSSFYSQPIVPFVETTATTAGTTTTGMATSGSPMIVEGPLPSEVRRLIRDCCGSDEFAMEEAERQARRLLSVGRRVKVYRDELSAASEEASDLAATVEGQTVVCATLETEVAEIDRKVELLLQERALCVTQLQQAQHVKERRLQQWREAEERVRILRTAVDEISADTQLGQSALRQLVPNLHIENYT